MRANLRWTHLGLGCLLTATTALAAPPGTLTGVRLESATTAPAAAAAASGKEAVWLGWQVQAVADGGDVCCYNGNGTTWHRRGCVLEKGGREVSMSVDGMSTDVPRGAGPGELLVLVRAQGGSVTEVRMLSVTCPGDFAGSRLVWFDHVEDAQSLRFLSTLLAPRVVEGALAAIALHTDGSANQLLEQAASRPGKAREDAIFWLGEARGQQGLEALRRLLLARPDAEVRAKIAFALSQSGQAEAIDELITMARSDPSAETRGEALFWLAQKGGERAEIELLRAIDQDGDLEARKKAVFALSQLEGARATPLLLRVLKSKSPAEIRREALFWLGQSDDPKAQDALEAVLLR